MARRRRRREKSRPIANYLKASRDNARLVPSQKRYQKRKRLNRWEKSAITRATNKINNAARGGTLVPLSKSQRKRLTDKSSIIGNGIRAVRLRGFNPETDTFSIRKGQMITRRRGAKRQWQFQEIVFEAETGMILAMEKFISNKVKSTKRPVDFQIWTGAGRISIGAEGLGATAIIAAFIGKYSEIDDDFEDWFFGIAWSVEE